MLAVSWCKYTRLNRGLIQRHDTASIYRKSRNNRTSRSLVVGCRRRDFRGITATHANVRLQILAKLSASRENEIKQPI